MAMEEGLNTLEITSVRGRLILQVHGNNITTMLLGALICLLSIVRICIYVRIHRTIWRKKRFSLLVLMSFNRNLNARVNHIFLATSFYY